MQYLLKNAMLGLKTIIHVPLKWNCYMLRKRQKSIEVEPYETVAIAQVKKG